MPQASHFVIPAKAGIQLHSRCLAEKLDSGLRRNDGRKVANARKRLSCKENILQQRF
jgi:hypothetical protein